MNKKTRNTIILIAALLVLAAAGLLTQHFLTKKPGAWAIVQVRGEVVARLSLWEDTEYKVEQINGTNLIVVKDGKVAVTEADCPDKVCVETGEIQTTNGVIACLPHELIITIEKEGESGPDGVAW